MTKVTQTKTRVSTTIVVEAVTKNIAQLVVGAFFMITGFLVGRIALGSEPHNDKLLYLGIGLAVFGGLVMPGIFGVVKPIYVTFFPNGLPIVGGRRASDPVPGSSEAVVVEDKQPPTPLTSGS